MNKSLDLAKKSEILGEIPIGAVLIYQDNIVASSGNEVILRNDPSAHAEIIVIREGAKHFKNYRLKENLTIYVTIFPCIMCMGAIFQSRISRVVYGSENYKNNLSFFLFEKNNTNISMNYGHITVYGGILSRSCSSILKNFFKKRRNLIQPKKF
ncbi:nucleoside deaminase [Candidatus Riesia pediculicola]|nr:nucleoside deaminase [Candidatus Riesia pediculicola]QOJ86447.1 nucleoside deaminase [Candidatus Riesia pediculicola]